MSRSEPFRLPSPSVAARRPVAQETASGAADVQLFGQDGARRGLREGEPAFKRARTAYLSTEWSGDDDRRPERGLLLRSRL